MNGYRLILSFLLLAGLTGCVSTEELYARYDQHLCPVVSDSGLPWYTDVNFPFGKAIVNEPEERKLNDNLSVLLTNPDYQVFLRGFADSVASQKVNLPLSSRRAQFVAKWFAANGIEPSRIQQAGLGKDLLLVSPVKNQGEAINRRVEMLLIDGLGQPVPLHLPVAFDETEAHNTTDRNRSAQ